MAQTSLIMIAGIDTVVPESYFRSTFRLLTKRTQAKTLAFGLTELAKNGELQESLRAEIHATLGTGRENIPYDSMPLLNAFIKVRVMIGRVPEGCV